MGTAEFQLAVHCCRSAFDPDAPLAAAPAVDWERFYQLSQFHRIQGLVWKSLSGAPGLIPDEIARQVAGDAARIAASNRASLPECERLSSALGERRIDFLVLKGVPLGVLAYGTPWLKAGVDIDLLIDPARLDQAVSALRDCGFRREDGRPEVIYALRAWHRSRKDSEWWKPGSSARVDLHTRITDSMLLIPGVGLQSPRQHVEITPDVRLPTLADEEMFAHLCVHGATSAWFRLKWIADLAAWLSDKDSGKIAHLYDRSQSLGAGRAAGQALLLADELFGLLGNLPELRTAIASDRRTVWLYQTALRQLAGRREPLEPTSRAGGTAAIHFSQFFLLPGPYFKVCELVRQGRAALAARSSE